MAIYWFLSASQFNTIMNKTQCSSQDTLDQLKATTAGSSSLLGLEWGAGDQGHTSSGRYLSRGRESPEATLWLSVDLIGFVTVIFAFLLGAVQAYPHSVGYN